MYRTTLRSAAGAGARYHYIPLHYAIKLKAAQAHPGHTPALHPDSCLVLSLSSR